MKAFADGITCLNLTDDFDCISSSVVYRIMLSLFLFSSAMFIVIMISSIRVAKILNEGLFFSKFTLAVLIFMVTLQLDNSVIVYFSNFAQIFSYIFIIWQVTLFVNRLL